MWKSECCLLSHQPASAEIIARTQHKGNDREEHPPKKAPCSNYVHFFSDSLSCFPYNLLHGIFFVLKTIVVRFTDVLTLRPVPSTKKVVVKIAQSYFGVKIFLKPLLRTY